MKSNLDSFFKTNELAEKEGNWFLITDTAGFLIRRFGGYNSPNVKMAMAKYHKPYARQIQAGTFSDEKQIEIMTKVFVESSIVDWKGIEIEGKDTPFSKEACTELLISLPDLAETLLQYASESNNFKEDLGNF